jgi:3-methylfumaryl-CoA hydratase
MSEALEDWIGRGRTQTAEVEAELLRRFAAAVGAPLEVETQFPPLGHWALFVDAVAPSGIGADGHPARGGFLPPVSLPRRMFAASDLRFEAPLEVGRRAELVSTIADLRHKSGRSGELVFVDVERRLSQGGTQRIFERQTIVYRDAGGPTPAVAPGPEPAGELWAPNRVDLFRFSAATYNSHRIHYDAPYATGAEGYPDLVVHGPFTASKLCELATRLAGKPLTTFGFRALSPLFVDQPVRLRAGEAANTVEAIRCDGAVAMSATYTA